METNEEGFLLEPQTQAVISKQNLKICHKKVNVMLVSLSRELQLKLIQGAAR